MLQGDFMKIITNNKKAFHEYFILSTYEAGIVLSGCEVKSIRLGHTNLTDSFIAFDKHNECFIKNMHISTYKDATLDTPDEKRSRKLLLSKQEIKKLMAKVREKGFTCVPLKVYLKNNLVKLEIALAKGKDLHDKRNTEKEKTAKREMEKAMKNFR